MKYFASVLVTLTLMGCASTGKEKPWELIQVGMNREDVAAIMGRPDTHIVEGELELMGYLVDTQAGWALAMRCGGAGFQGAAPPECNPQNRLESFLIQLSGGVVTAYKLDSQKTSHASNSNSQPNPVRQSSEPVRATQDPNFACEDAMRRHKLGLISFERMRDACR
jgi:hypothetical protein